MTHDDAPGAPDSGSAIDVRGLRVGYRSAGREEAVRGVDLRVEAGETVAIVGESGSGKSSLAAALLGLHQGGATVRAERLRVLGREMREAPERGWRELRRNAVSLVPQDPLVGLNPAMRLGQQVREALQAAPGTTPGADWRRRAVLALRQAGLDDAEGRLHQYPHELSGGQRQRVLIAIALACDPRLVIADEPTSALDVTVQRRILDHLDSLVRERGISLLLITHDLGVAAGRSDRVLVLDHGRVVEQGPTQRVLTEPQSTPARRLLEAAPRFSPSGGLLCGRYRRGLPDLPAKPMSTAPTTTASGGPLVSFSGVGKTYRVPKDGSRSRSGRLRALDGVDLDVPKGQTLGVVGESGSGKSTLLRVALALAEPSEGRVAYDGEDLHRLAPRRLRDLRRRFQLVQQDPYASLDPRYTVARCIVEPLQAARTGSRTEQRERVGRLMELVELPKSFLDRLPRELSGGQRQRVAIARALAAEPETVYLDEPVSALDVTVQKQLLDTLVAIQRELGVTYVLVSHDLSVIARVAHRVAVMRHGRVLEEGPTPEVLGNPRDTYTRELIDAVPRHVVPGPQEATGAAARTADRAAPRSGAKPSTP